MTQTAYQTRRAELERYFDRTAVDNWVALTSERPVSRIRATVRAGREEMRQVLMSWLPEDMTGLRLLDAGCGTGALSIAAAERGAEVVGVDLSPSLISVAAELAASVSGPGSLRFLSGDMTAESLGVFDHVVAMDSVIHYEPADTVAMLGQLAMRARRSVLFTFAPRTPLLALMHASGKLFPRSDRSPAIVPISERRLRTSIEASTTLDGWAVGPTHCVSSAFYKSQAMALEAR